MVQTEHSWPCAKSAPSCGADIASLVNLNDFCCPETAETGRYSAMKHPLMLSLVLQSGLKQLLLLCS